MNAQSSGDLKEYELSLVVMQKKKVPTLNLNAQKFAHLPISNPDLHSQAQVSLGIDFTFNTIKNVKKVTWKDDAPWFREISDGFCWLCYCQNPKCLAYK